MKSLIGRLFLVAAMAGLAITGAAASTTTGNVTDAEIAKKVTHEIRMYPRYTVFDNVNLRVSGGQVELLGEVSQPFKKADLGRLAQQVPGVQGVTNNLKVLPLSSFDDDLRLRVARAIYGSSTLGRYGMGAQPAIHIIVDNGQVTLEGVVMNQMDKQIAGMRASSAGLSFGQVVNNLRVENSNHKG